MLPLLVALAIAAPPSPGTFIDATGDSGTAPDITRIVVGGEAAGRMTFTVSFATPYGASSSIYVYLDADGQTSTGDANGADYRIGPAGVEAWDPAAKSFEPAGDPDATFSVAPGGMSVELSAAAADVGNPTTVNAVVQSLDGAGGAGHQDTAIAVWSKTAGPGLKVALSHAGAAKAGAVWAVTLTAAGGDTSATADQAAVSCKGGLPVLSQKVLGVHGGNVTGLCLYRVAKKLKAKKVHATIGVTLAGATVSKAFTAKVK